MNLVLITLDTLRADHLGCYGYGKNTSPTLDALAAESILFEQAIAQSAVTPVSHASILTGLNPYNHGLRSLHGGVEFCLPEDQHTLAEFLLAQGYTTGGFVSAFPATKHYGLHQGFQTWDQDFESHHGKGLLTEKGIVNTGKAQRRGDKTTDRVLAWLKQQKGKPFFAWIHYFDVHDGIVRPPSSYSQRFPPASTGKLDDLRANYDAEIAFLDGQIKRVLKELDQMGVRDHTVLAVIGDHGQGLGDHQWWGHCILYQEQVRLPFILSIPRWKGGRRIPYIVRSTDLAPTLLELLGVKPNSSASFDGESLLGFLKEGVDPKHTAYSESINDLTGYYPSPIENESLYAVRTGRWKLIAHREEGEYKRMELYDLDSDPRELYNVFQKKSEVVERLVDYLEGLEAIEDFPARPVLDELTRERLKAIGYVK